MPKIDANICSTGFRYISLMSCLTGDLQSEITELFYEQPDDQQGAATLIYLALTKLHSNSYACVQALQGCIINFRLSNIAYEDVSKASSWLKALVKHLRITNDVPTQAMGSILAGMSTSQSTQFNSYISVLDTMENKPAGLSRTGSSVNSRIVDRIFDLLEQCGNKYRQLVQAGHWPAGKPASSTTTTTAADTESTFISSTVPADAPASAFVADSSLAKKLLDSIPTEDLLALVLNGGDTKKLNSRRCFNPLCNSDKHQLRDCPGPFPKDWNHNRGRGRSRSTSRGRPTSRSRSTDRSRKRDSTPGLRKKSSVSFDDKSTKHRAYKATVEDDCDASDADSVSSDYNPDMGSAFLLRQSKG
jgi:hypothetical protein